MERAAAYKSANSIIVCCGTSDSSRSCPAVGSALAQMGPSVTIFPCCWYVVTSLAVSEVKAKLSSPLRDDETLFVVDATNHEAAWRNIRADAAELIKETWPSGAVPTFLRHLTPRGDFEDEVARK